MTRPPTIPWQQLNDRQKTLVEQLFVAQAQQCEAIAEPGKPLPDFGFQQLYQQVQQPDQPFSLALQQALSREPLLRQTLHRLLQKTSVVALPRAAAASSGPITRREQAGFVIQLRPSRVESGQCYVLIQLPPQNPFVPRNLYLYEADGSCQKFPLPAPQEGRIQLLTQADSALATGIGNHRTELFLK